MTRQELKDSLIAAIDRSGKSFDKVDISSMQSFLQKNGAKSSEITNLIQEVYAYYQGNNKKVANTTTKSSKSATSDDFGTQSAETGTKKMDYSSITPTLKERFPRKSVFGEIQKVTR